MSARNWDSLDIAILINACLEGFALEFYGVSFTDLEDEYASRIVNAAYSELKALRQAQTGSRQ